MRQALWPSDLYAEHWCRQGWQCPHRRKSVQSITHKDFFVEPADANEPCRYMPGWQLYVNDGCPDDACSGISLGEAMRRFWSGSRTGELQFCGQMSLASMLQAASWMPCTAGWQYPSHFATFLALTGRAGKPRPGNHKVKIEAKAARPGSCVVPSTAEKLLFHGTSTSTR